MIVKRARPGRLRPRARRDARLHRGARRATPPTSSGSASIRRSSPRASPARPSTCSTPATIPVVRDRPRRPGHVPRARPGRRLSAGRPAPARHLRQGIRVRLEQALMRRSRPTASAAIACAASPASTCASTLRSTMRCCTRPTAGARPASTASPRSPRSASRCSRHCAYHGVALNVAMDLRALRADQSVRPCRARTVDLSTIGVRAPGTRCGEHPRRQARRYLSP